jgi:hypothetical protein
MFSSPLIAKKVTTQSASFTMVGALVNALVSTSRRLGLTRNTKDCYGK